MNGAKGLYAVAMLVLIAWASLFGARKVARLADDVHEIRLILQRAWPSNDSLDEKEREFWDRQKEREYKCSDSTGRTWSARPDGACYAEDRPR